MKNMDRAFLLCTRKRGFFWEKKQATLPMITFPLPSFLSDEGRSVDSSYCTLIHCAKISSIAINCFNLFEISFLDWLSANTKDTDPGVSGVSNDQKKCEESKTIHYQINPSLSKIKKHNWKTSKIEKRNEINYWWNFYRQKILFKLKIDISWHFLMYRFWCIF